MSDVHRWSAPRPSGSGSIKNSRIALRKLAPRYAGDDERGSDIVDPKRGIDGGMDGIFAISTVRMTIKRTIELRDYEGFSPRQV